MKKNVSIFSIIFCLVLVVLYFSGCGSGGGGEATPVNTTPVDNFGSILKKEPIAEKESTEKLWTKDQIQKAMENPLNKIMQLPSQETTPIPEPTKGVPKSSEPFNPESTNRNFLNKKEMITSIIEATYVTCPASNYITGYLPYYFSFPERTQGMLAISMTGSELDAVCSATLVDRSLIMTAAHCVADLGKWYADWVFIPGFNGTDNWKPFGIRMAKYVFIYQGWYNNSYYPADVAFIVLKEPVGDQLGWLGFKVNQTRQQTWLQVGYPAEYPYQGVTLAYNVSSYAYDECSFGAPCLNAVGSLLTQGSSGGPWVLTDNYVNGLNSAKPYSCLQTTFSPYFGDKVWDLYQLAKTYQ